MANARLRKVSLRNFKSFGEDEQSIDLRSLTVVIGRNNSGKSTILQSLLLLKQTLLDRRPEVTLALRGDYVQASSLRELTHDRPGDMANHGPEIVIEWVSTVRTSLLLNRWSNPANIVQIASESGFEWLASTPKEVELTTTLGLYYREVDSVVSLQPVVLKSRTSDGGYENPSMTVMWDRVKKNYHVRWNNDKPATGIDVRMDHFLPYLDAKRKAREAARKIERLFRLLYEQPLDDLKETLVNLSYVGAMRAEPAELYPRPTSIPTREVLPRGDKAPELFYSHRAALVHALENVGNTSSDAPVEFSERIVARPLEVAVAKTLQDLGIDVAVSLADLGELGFRILFNDGSFQHVGRGIGQILPIIVAALISEPLLGKDVGDDISRAEYLKQCTHTPALIFEEVESGLHPKSQTLLAHILVGLARMGRQIIVETHSDHLVRRLRSLVARAASAGSSESWLLDNVRLVHVEQGQNHVTVTHDATFTATGWIEEWPTEFMDEASDEEQSIYLAGIKKELPKAVDAKNEYLRHVRSLESKR